MITVGVTEDSDLVVMVISAEHIEQTTVLLPANQASLIAEMLVKCSEQVWQTAQKRDD